MPAAAPQAPNDIALEIDVATSLALSRATTRAVAQLSGEARQAMLGALAREAEAQETHGGPVGQLVAALIAAYADELK